MESGNHPNGSGCGRLSRRSFLAAGGSLVAGLAVAACAATSTSELTAGEMARPAKAPILPSPAPATPVAAGENAPLEQFLALSSVLTGYDNLNRVVGQVYLESIQQISDYAMTVDELAQAAGLPSDTPPAVADLESAGLFDNPDAQTLADAIISMWYTGIYTNAEGAPQVATYVDALMWRALSFTKPPTICGSPGFWAQAPQETFA